MKLLKLLISILCFAFCAPIHADDFAPYIYYYSYTENLFVVERADGKERSSFALEVLQERPDNIIGPGWSPNGIFFAFGVRPSGRPNAYIVNVSTTSAHQINMWRVGAMHWSPDSDYILVSGNVDPCEGYCSHETNWLIDGQSGEILAWLDIRRGAQSPGAAPIVWDNEIVKFYRFEENFPNSRLTSYYEISMNINGEVIKRPIKAEEYFEHFVPMDEGTDLDDRVFSSQSGGYTISTAGQLTNIEEQSTTQLPTPDFGVEGAARIVNVHWHSSEEWILVSYNIWSGGIDGVSIVRSDGSEYRELTMCASSSACVGWLPTSAMHILE